MCLQSSTAVSLCIPAGQARTVSFKALFLLQSRCFFYSFNLIQRFDRMLQKISLVAVLLGLSLNPVLHASEAPRADLQSTTASGRSVEIYSQLSPLEINRIHSWTLVIHDAAGNPLSGAKLALTGGMPDHNHGIPTLPQITEQADPGVYSLQGIRFHMPGAWQIVLLINHAGDSERVVIDFQL